MDISSLLSDGLGFFADIIVGFITTVASLFILFKLKPKVIISTCIGRSKSYDGKDEYLFKIVNMGRYPIVNIKAELYYINKAEVDGGVIDEYTRISLKTDEIMTLGGAHERKVSDEYVFHFSTRETILDKLRNDNKLSLRIRIQATHSLSQFSQVFQVDYYGVECIKNNEFEYGISTNIKDILG